MAIRAEGLPARIRAITSFRLGNMNRADLEIIRGNDYTTTVNVMEDDGETPADLTGYTVDTAILNNLSDPPAAAVLAFTTVISQNTITLGLTHDQTQTLLGSRYVWDLETTDNLGWVSTLMYGQVTVRPPQK